MYWDAWPQPFQYTYTGQSCGLRLSKKWTVWELTLYFLFQVASSAVFVCLTFTAFFKMMVLLSDFLFTAFFKMMVLVSDFLFTAFFKMMVLLSDFRYLKLYETKVSGSLPSSYPFSDIVLAAFVSCCFGARAGVCACVHVCVSLFSRLFNVSALDKVDFRNRSALTSLHGATVK